jgi:peptide/nickel transport system ATP-binding protein
VAQVCDRVNVMYAGRIVEAGTVDQVFAGPRHPYTRGLFDALPRMDGGREPLIPIAGTVPDPRFPPKGCSFAPRCVRANHRCGVERPNLLIEPDGRLLACFDPVPHAAPQAQPQYEEAR